MADTEYLFVDGGYLRKVHRDALQQLFPEVGDIDLRRVRSHFGSKRAFYYDSPPARKAGESDEEFETRHSGHERLMDSFRSAEGCHVRLGTTSGATGRSRQKEVDVLLAVDMLTHAFAKNMTSAILLAGDLDFRPIVEALIRLGTFVRVAYEPGSASRKLYWAADYGLKIGVDELHRWSNIDFIRQYKLPVSSASGAAPRGHVFKQGRLGEATIRLCQEGDGSLRAYIENLPLETYESTHLWVTHQDLGFLEKYLELKFPGLEWRT